MELKPIFAAISACTLFCAASFAAGIQISEGAVDRQVFQRGTDNRADVKLEGTADDAGARRVEARVTTAKGAVSGLKWHAVGTVNNGKWSGTIKGVPTGGPYTIEVRVAGVPATAAVKEVLVGDLWVLGGQSNMQGVGDLVDAEPPDPQVHSFDLADNWVIAKEPLHVLVGATDRVHWPRNKEKIAERYTGEKLAKYVANLKKGAGLGLPFAAEMVRRTGVPVGLVPCAHGGTSMDQWSPALKDQGGDSLYGGMLRRFQAVGGKVTGILWYQGESDSSPKASPLFQDKFEKLVAAIRADFKQPDLPFYYVQIGRFVNKGGEAGWNLVQEAQRKAESRIARSGMVAAIDMDLDDLIHVGTPDLKLLGQRMAKLATTDLFPSLKGYGPFQRGPRPVSAIYRDGAVRVAFSNVNGKLKAAGRIAGFSIHNASGEPLASIYKIRVDPADPSALLLYTVSKPPEGAVLHYGYGKDPYCNLRDEADMGAPVFGPMPIQ
ncbi:MAG: sialate O-acetylesterase [Bryobacteraceae bacterium]